MNKKSKIIKLHLLDIFLILCLLLLFHLYITILTSLYFDFSINMLNCHIFLLNDNIVYSTNDIKSEVLFSNNYTNTNTNRKNDKIDNNNTNHIPLVEVYRGKIRGFYKNVIYKTKRRLLWEIIEKDENKYSSYKELKNS